GFTAAIEHVNLSGAEAEGGGGRVDGGVAAADDDYAAAHGRAAMGLVFGDEAQRVDDAGQGFTGDIEGLRASQADAQEDDVEVFLELLDAQFAADFHAEAEVDAQGADQFDLLLAVGGTQFVLGDAIGIQAASQRAAIENGHREALLAQPG